MSSTTLTFPLGVCILDAPLPNLPHVNAYAAYISEVLAHAGLGYSAVEPATLASVLPQLRVLVTVGQADLPHSTKEQLRAWVEQGGAWLSIAGTCGVPELFGVQDVSPAFSIARPMPQTSTLGEGYLMVGDTAHPVLGHVEIPLHFFNGLSVIAAPSAGGTVLATTSTSHQQDTSRCGVMEKLSGKGRCLLIAPDAIGAIVRIGQGVAITRDGVPAPDGTGAVTDGVLKCDDGIVLDWHFDRQEVPGVPGLKGFLQPVADQWRELVLRSIFHLAKEQHVTLPLLWLYPRNLPALAHMSFDSDFNDPVLARKLLEVMEQAGIKTTWCIILPGYEPGVFAQIAAAGHELATHFDALERPWGENSFHEQWSALCKRLPRRPTSNKNHYTRWEGDTEFFVWCEKRGIQLDQSKGPSKAGEMGFLFGTCHPYFPIDPQGQAIDVLELPFFTQDLAIFVPPISRVPVRENALKAHGILHMLFHPAHIAKEGVEEAILNTVREAQAASMEWWTAQAINSWERARRKVRWQKQERGEVTLRVEEALLDATLLFLGGEPEQLLVNGTVVETNVVTRWGFEFTSAVLSLEAGSSYRLGGETSADRSGA